MGEKTFKGKFPVTLLLGVVFLVVTVILLELAARSRLAGSYLPAPSKGINHRYIDLKLSLLQRVIEEEGPVDCIFMGTSMVAAGIEPVSFSQSYKETTGKDIRCFNFGIEALSLPSAAVLTRILAKLYKPKLIITGIFSTDFNNRFPRIIDRKVMKNPWIRHQLGNFNIKGWITDHFLSIQYVLRFFQWMKHPEYSSDIAHQESKLSLSGYSRVTLFNETKIVGYIPNPERQRRIREKLKYFRFSPDRFTDLNSIIPFLSHSGVQLVLVEMPTHPAARAFFVRGERDHIAIMAEVARWAKQRGIVFIPVSDQKFVSDKFWRNSNHLNVLGAKCFGQWLGEQIGRAVKEGKLGSASLRSGNDGMLE
jgi:hypothetical protein